MRAMILAAGRGGRMGELTTEVPKPLLKVRGHYLIEYSLRALVNIGVQDIVINVSYFADMIKSALGDGERYGGRLHYSYEETALETGGGIAKALPLLGADPFIVISGDIITDYSLAQLPTQPTGLAHLVLVENPYYHPEGDFCLYGQRIYYGKGQTYTFASLGIYRPELFIGCPAGKFRLTEVLKKEILNQKITGEVFHGYWQNVGTAEELEASAHDLPANLQIT